ncbi:MAG: mechanosensitive ion channel [Mycoplasmatota bacterium]
MLDFIFKYVLIKEIVAPILIILGSFVLFKLAKKLVKGFFKTRKVDKKTETIKMVVINVLKYFIIVIAALLILEVYGVNTQSIIASLGVLGIVIGLAIQDVLKDFLAGAFIIAEGHYSIGDNVTIDTFRGDVVGLGAKTTKVKAYTGEVKYIANRNILEVINHSVNNSLAVVEFEVAYDTDNVKLEKVINKMLERVNKENDLIIGEIKFLGVNSLKNSSIEYKITAETKTMEHFGIERLLKKEIVETLQKNNIEIPFSQLVVHDAKRI